MQSRWLALIFLFLIYAGCSALAQDIDLTGTWESAYQIGPISEIMKAIINQVDSDILGSFSVKSASGDEYSGILFGTVDGDRVKANYLVARDRGNNDPQLVITHIDSNIIDANTLRGTYYVQDSDMNALTGPFEAFRK